MATVLVVDDSQSNRELVVTLLKHRGHQSLEADDGAQGLALVRERHPDLVISDILMPTMDGFEFVRQMRADPAIADTEVMFFTATYHEREARRLARGCGVASVLTKPCKPEDVLLAIDASLRRNPTRMDTHVGAGFDREHVTLLTNKLHTAAEDLAISNSRLSALIDLNMQLASERDPRLLLDSVCRRARDLIGVKYATLAVRENDGAEGVFSTTSGLDPAVTAALPIVRIDDGALGVVQRERRPRRFALLNGDPRSVGLPAGFPPVHSSLIAPIASVEKTYGWICLVDKLGGEPFSDDEESLLMMLAGQVGRIYESSALYQQVRSHMQRLELESDQRRRAVDELRGGEPWFRQLAESIRAVFFLTDPGSSKTFYVSPAYEDIWGRSCASLYADPRSWMDLIHGDDRERVRLMVGASGESGRFEFEYRIVRADNATRWIWARGFPIRDQAGAIYRVASLAEDITDRKHSEQRSLRLNCVHAMLSGSNGLIVRGRKRDELFREICRVAVDRGRFALAWIGLLDPQSGTMRAVAAAGADQEFACQVQIPLVGGGSKTLSLATPGIGGQDVVVCNDLGKHGDDLSLRTEMIGRGFRSSAALPLVAGGKTVGVLVLYANELDFFDGEEVLLLQELASGISFGLEHVVNDGPVKFLAYCDTLTGLPNRAFFRERLDRRISGERDDLSSSAIVIVELNRFKTINDSLGRHIGDQLLQELAVRLVISLGGESDVARIEGNQFAAVIPDATDRSAVLRRLERWWDECFATPFLVGDVEVTMCAKAGIALFPGDGRDADALLHCAEAALSRAKVTDETFVFYSRQMTDAHASL